MMKLQLCLNDVAKDPNRFTDKIIEAYSNGFQVRRSGFKGYNR